MNLETTLSTIAAFMPDEIQETIATAAGHIPGELKQAIRHAANYMPTQLDMGTVILFILYFSAASLILGVLSRMFLGKRSSLNHSLSSVMGILCIYALTIVVYTFKPWNLHSLLSPLPFVTFSGEYLIVLPIFDSQFAPLCTEILSLIFLAFLVNLMDTFVPRGEHIATWYLLRFGTMLLCMLLHYFARIGFKAIFPNILVTYAPAILLLLIAFAMFSGILGLIAGLFIAVVNPFMGAMYTFFFSSVVGKQLSKAVFTSAIVCCIFCLMEYFGYTVICITSAALLAYIPLALVFLVLWYLIGHVL